MCAKYNNFERDLDCGLFTCANSRIFYRHVSSIINNKLAKSVADIESEFSTDASEYLNL